MWGRGPAQRKSNIKKKSPPVETLWYINHENPNSRKSHTWAPLRQSHPPHFSLSSGTLCKNWEFSWQKFKCNTGERGFAAGTSVIHVSHFRSRGGAFRLFFLKRFFYSFLLLLPALQKP
jgi:hypothetical protein